MTNAPNFMGQSIHWTFWCNLNFLSCLSETLRVLHITSSLRVLRATEKELNSFFQSQSASVWSWKSSNLICKIILIGTMLTFDGNDQLGNDRQDFFWPSTRQQVLDSLSQEKHSLLNSQKRGTLRPGRQRRHTGAGSPWVRRRRGEGSNGSPGTQEAPVQLWGFCFARIVLLLTFIDAFAAWELWLWVCYSASWELWDQTFQLILFPRPSCFSAIGKSPLAQRLHFEC